MARAGQGQCCSVPGRQPVVRHVRGLSVRVGRAVAGAALVVGGLAVAAAGPAWATTTTTVPVTTTTVPPTTSTSTTTTSTTQPTTTTTVPPTTSTSTSTTTTTTTPAPAATKSGGLTGTAVALIVLAILLVVAVILVVVLFRRRTKRQAVTEWHGSVLPAVVDARLARESLLSGNATSDNPELRGSVDIQVDRAARALEHATRFAPNEQARNATNAVAGSLRGLAFSIEADRLLRQGAASPSGMQLAEADEARRSRLSELDASLARLSSHLGAPSSRRLPR
jgi:hypothetical protein